MSLEKTTLRLRRNVVSFFSCSSNKFFLIYCGYLLKKIEGTDTAGVYYTMSITACIRIFLML